MGSILGADGSLLGTLPSVAVPAPSTSSAALVTGASSGIGVDLARAFARRGHNVVIVARRLGRLQELAEELEHACGTRAEPVECDLADLDSRRAMVERVDKLGLRIDALVNNAGFGTAGLFQRLEGEHEADMVRVNCEAIVALCGHYVPRMVEAGGGAVLNVASTAAFQPLPTQATYSATKAFVLSFTQALAADLHDTGVTATALCPGPVRTEFIEVAHVDRDASKLPGFAWLHPAEVAEDGVRGLEQGRGVVVPGKLNRLTSIGGQHVPRSLLMSVGRRIWRLGDS